MMNYVKSEFYRITHTKGIYFLTGALAALVVLFNVATHYFGRRYATTSYSYSQLVNLPMLYAVMGAVIAFLLYEGNRRNGNLKNTVASGISRTKIFAGECIVSMAAATVVMVVTLAVWIISAGLLLEKTGPVELNDLLLEVPMVYFIAVASLISGIVFLELFEKNIIGILTWYSIWFLIPRILLYLGIRFETLYSIVMWIPSNFFGVNAMHVNTIECITVWDTTDGMIKCLLSGIIGIVIFTFSGMALVRKKDL